MVISYFRYWSQIAQFCWVAGVAAAGVGDKDGEEEDGEEGEEDDEGYSES